MEMTRDVTIRGADYQVNRLDALTGSWIAMTIMTKMLPAAVSEEKLGLTGLLPSGRAELSETDFRKIQLYALAACKRYEGPQRALMVVLTTDGRFALKDLEHDIVTVLGLTMHSLIFSITPFFEDGGLASVMEAAPDFPPQKVRAA